MFANLAQACSEVQELSPRPTAVFIDGDLAVTAGTTEDYATLVQSLEPLRKHGLPIHLALGNHDHRGRFWEALSKGDQARTVDDRHVLVVPARLANWFVLDSLDETNKTPGVLGDAQLAWLAAALDQRADKPALVMVHHNPDDRPKPGGLVETKALLELLAARRHVKALIFGHTHDWKLAQHEGIHLVNLPPVAYAFAATKPSGWVDCQLYESGAKLILACLNHEHAQHRQVVDLAWR
jgi:3',5'-cyclic AMP phosphodiesterase CpdA